MVPDCLSCALRLCGVALVLAVTTRAADEGAPIPAGLALKVCEAEDEWPPFTYRERVGGKPTGRVTGVGVDVLDEILAGTGITYKVEFVPWKRCEEMLRRGMYQFVINASYNDERARNFVFSKPYYWTHSYYYFSHRWHPDGLIIRHLADVKQYRVCGIIGYNYATYGLKPTDIDQSTSGFPLMIAKMHAGHCDLFIEKHEVIVGMGVINTAMAALLASDDLGRAPLPDVPPTSFSMIASRALPWAPTLIAMIDAGIDRLQKSGEIARIVDKYVKR